MVELSKEYWKNVSCMVLQDSIKYKRNEIIRYEGLSEALEKAEIIPLNRKIENIVSDLISQSTEQERKLRVTARSIGCKFIKKGS